MNVCRYSIKRKKSSDSMNLSSLKALARVDKTEKNGESMVGRQRIIVDSRLRSLRNKSSNFLSVDNSPTYKTRSRHFMYAYPQKGNEEEEEEDKIKNSHQSSSSVFLKPFKFSHSERSSKQESKKGRLRCKSSGNESSGKSSRSSSRSDRSSDESHPSLKFSTRRNISKNKMLLERFELVHFLFTLERTEAATSVHSTRTFHNRVSGILETSCS